MPFRGGETEPQDKKQTPLSTKWYKLDITLWSLFPAQNTEYRIQNTEYRIHQQKVFIVSFSMIDSAWFGYSLLFANAKRFPWRPEVTAQQVWMQQLAEQARQHLESMVTTSVQRWCLNPHAPPPSRGKLFRII
jgi:hypothetical protein